MSVGIKKIRELKTNQTRGFKNERTTWAVAYGSHKTAHGIL